VGVDQALLIGQSSHILGTRDARVVVVEFGDFQCPACAYANPIFMQLIESYKDNPNVSFVSRHFPLPQHANAMIAAEAAEAAGAQGKFWEMSNMLYERQNEWSGNPKPLDIFVGYAQQLGLNTKAFSESVNGKKFEDVINKDRSDARSLGINSTPTFFVGGEKIQGVPSLEEFKKKIESRL